MPRETIGTDDVNGVLQSRLQRQLSSASTRLPSTQLTIICTSSLTVQCSKAGLAGNALALVSKLHKLAPARRRLPAPLQRFAVTQLEVDLTGEARRQDVVRWSGLLAL